MTPDVVVWRGGGTHDLGMVVNYTGRATVHYLDCPWYLLAVNTAVPLRAHAKVVLCAKCRPAEDDVRIHPPEVRWFEGSPSEVSVVPTFDMERLEERAARRALGYGRRLVPRNGWEDS